MSSHPFDLSEDAWSELTDPVNFVVGSVLILFYKPKRVTRVASPASVTASRIPVSARVGATVGMTPWVVLPVLVPVLVGLWFAQFGIGDPFWYAATLLIAGALTVVPGRLAELRRTNLVRGVGYPRTLRKMMWFAETAIWFGAIIAIFVWNFGGAQHHSVARAVVWGLFAVSLSDFAALGAARTIAAAANPAVTAQEGVLTGPSDPKPVAQHSD